MARTKKEAYFCADCGATYSKWMGKCLDCGAWNSIEERNSSAGSSDSSKLVRLLDVEPGKVSQRRKTQVDFLDRVLGGGLPAGATVLLAGEPGIGKSTLLFQMFAVQKDLALYVSAEESVDQVALRFSSAKTKPSENLYAFAENRLSEIVAQIERLKPKVVAIDSIQMIVADERDRVRGGSAAVREVAETLIGLAKKHNLLLWIVGHVTKEGDIAGPRTLEHLVDSVLLFSSAEDASLRILQTQKHRFGQSGELALLEISKDGLSEKEGAESFWLQDHDQGTSGVAYAPVMMGSRVYCIEVQALCAPTHFPSPRRSTSGFDMNRLYLLLAVLEKRLKLKLSSHDVYVNIVGGLKVQDPALDLAVAAALFSAQTEKPIPASFAFCGEVGLTGEIRNVAFLKDRAKSLLKTGKTNFVAAPHPELKRNELKGLNLYLGKSLSQVLTQSFKS